MKPVSQTTAVAPNGTNILSTLAGADGWINSAPLTAESLKGKVVLVDFWTYSCINCLRTLPYLNALYAKYGADSLVVIGVHTPEFPFEKDQQNVRKAVQNLGISYPVAIDTDYHIWRGFNNQYWPAHYFLDAAGRIRYHHFGEGHLLESEQWVRQLLNEAHHDNLPAPLTQIAAAGVLAAPDAVDIQSYETYLGYKGADAEDFVSPGGLIQNKPSCYKVPADLDLNDWGLSGTWKDEAQSATLVSPTGHITYRFHARDLHLVLSTSSDSKQVRFRVTIDGKAPGADHGMDIDANGDGTINGQRLYQLIRQKGKVQDHVFQIEFLDSGAQAYAFTFG